jgi:xanthine dehydrogenase YagS FAD-binding subunit
MECIMDDLAVKLGMDPLELRLRRPRVALGCISAVPHQVEAANQFLEGKALDEPNASQAADMILKGAQPLDHNGYKVPLAHTLIRRALLQLKA